MFQHHPRKSSQRGKADAPSRDLAMNVGIDFKTPEEFFLNEEPLAFARTFDPKAYLNAVSCTSTDTSKLCHHRDYLVSC